MSGLFLLNFRLLTYLTGCHCLGCCFSCLVHSLRMVEPRAVNYDLSSLVFCLWHSASFEHDLLLTLFLTFGHDAFILQSWPLIVVCYILLILSNGSGELQLRGAEKGPRNVVVAAMIHQKDHERWWMVLLRARTCLDNKSESLSDLVMPHQDLWVKEKDPLWLYSE